MNVTTGRGQANPFVTGGVYGVLFLFGVVQGMLGSFLYSGMTGLVPAIGWIAASFVLSMPVASGSVIIANSTAGKWYLYGGTLCAVGGVVLASLTRVRPR